MELKKVVQLLIRETNQDTILRLLWVFRKVAAPELHPRFIELASSSNNDIRSSARIALAQFRHPHVGEFARNILLKEGLRESDWEVLDLLLLNYEPSDASLIIPALHSLRPPYNDVHWLGMSVLRICEEHLAPELAEALYWVYDSTPCTTCRRDCFKCLSEFGEVAPHIVEECCYDASEQTRQLAQEMMSCDP